MVGAMDRLTIGDILAARRTIRPYLRPTPLYTYPALDRLVGGGGRIFVKHENHSPIGSFKLRGALNALSAHVADGRVAAASTGNHGIGVAYAARLLGMQATIVMPEWANPEKIAVVESLGGQVVLYGRDEAESQWKARELAVEQHGYYADDGGDRLIAAGAGTVALEILEELPDLDLLVVPLGDGALAGGCGVVVRALAPRARTLGVQSESCPAMVLSWRRGEVIRAECHTLADGLAVVEPHPAAVKLLRAVLDEACLVSEPDLARAILVLLQQTHNLAEAAGAAALAACLAAPDRIAGRRTAIVLSGGNLNTQSLATLLNPRPSS
jgi:threonine dehydratase